MLGDDDSDDWRVCKTDLPDGARCEICGGVIGRGEPYADYRWGGHQCCDLCAYAHDHPCYVHAFCLSMLASRFRLDHEYMPDEPFALLRAWAEPVCWRVRWDPEGVSVAEAMEAAEFVRRCIGDSYDPAYDCKPFDLFSGWDSLAEFKAEDMMPISRCLGLSDDEAAYLPCLLKWDGSAWSAHHLSRLSNAQLVNRLRACMRAGKRPPRIGPPVERVRSFSVWDQPVAH